MTRFEAQIRNSPQMGPRPKNENKHSSPDKIRRLQLKWPTFFLARLLFFYYPSHPNAPLLSLFLPFLLTFLSPPLTIAFPALLFFLSSLSLEYQTRPKKAFLPRFFASLQTNLCSIDLTALYKAERGALQLVPG